MDFLPFLLIIPLLASPLLLPFHLFSNHLSFLNPNPCDRPLNPHLCAGRVSSSCFLRRIGSSFSKPRLPASLSPSLRSSSLLPTSLFALLSTHQTSTPVFSITAWKRSGAAAQIRCKMHVRTGASLSVFAVGALVRALLTCLG